MDEKTNKVTGVMLSNGRFIKADAVVCNADAPFAYNHMLPPSNYMKKMQKMKYTASTISFYWGLDCQLSCLTAHNIFLNGDYKRSFDDIFENFGLPNKPSFYIHVPSKMDRSAAPEGRDCLTVLVPISYINNAVPQDWDKMTAFARRFILDVIQDKFNVDLESHITFEYINTPLTWRDKFNLYNGSALGLSHNLTQIGYLRPSITHDKYSNLFFVGNKFLILLQRSFATKDTISNMLCVWLLFFEGASVHPGTGVPVVLHGAKLVADELNALLLDRADEEKQGVKVVQKRRKTPSIFSSWVAFVYLAICLLFIYFISF